MRGGNRRQARAERLLIADFLGILAYRHSLLSCYLLKRKRGWKGKAIYFSVCVFNCPSWDGLLHSRTFSLPLAVCFPTAEALLSECISYQGMRQRGTTAHHRVVLEWMDSVRLAWDTCKVIVSLWAWRKTSPSGIDLKCDSHPGGFLWFDALSLPQISSWLFWGFPCRGSTGPKYCLGSLRALTFSLVSWRRKMIRQVVPVCGWWPISTWWWRTAESPLAI